MVRVRPAGRGKREINEAGVRLAPSPATDYYEFERAMYESSVRAGEQILIVQAADLPDIARGVRDFWIFDDVAVGEMLYDEVGRFLGADVVEDRHQVLRYLEIAESLTAAAAPLTAGPRDVA